jgi:hypothetical protein
MESNPKRLAALEKRSQMAESASKKDDEEG